MNGSSPAVRMAARHTWFLLLGLASLVLFRSSLAVLLHLALHDERYSYIAFVPVISAVLIYLDRGRIFGEAVPAKAAGSSLISVGIMLYGFVWVWREALGESGGLSLLVAALVLVWVGGFLLCYGFAASRAGLFPLIFLVLLIPPPSNLLDQVVVWLQKSSAEVSYLLFKVAGVPVLRQGFVFSLPGLTIEVAEQCSGIRSSISLLIASILAGHLLLHSAGKKLCLSLLTIPIVIAKNALRIVVLSLLGAYVDRDVLFGRLHRSSGLVFSPLALLVLAWLLWMLYKSEKKSLTKG